MDGDGVQSANQPFLSAGPYPFPCFFSNSRKAPAAAASSSPPGLGMLGWGTTGRGEVGVSSPAGWYGAPPQAKRRPCGRPVSVTVRPVGGRVRRRSLVVVRAGGPPSTNALILAFVLPLSLFVGTLITAARVADDLDERFLREMEINQAIMEENEASGDNSDEDDDDRACDEGEEEEEDEQPTVEKQKPAVVGAAAPRTRNRPRRLLVPKLWSDLWNGISPLHLYPELHSFATSQHHSCTS